jgi:hypothetical protein
MEEEQKNRTQKNMSNPKIFWGGIAIGVAVLAAGVFFYVNSNGGSLPDTEEPKNFEEAVQEATVRFVTLRGRLESEQVSQEIVEEIADMREDLERAASKETDETVLEMWRQMDEDLRDVEQILRASLEEESGS